MLQRPVRMDIGAETLRMADSRLMRSRSCRMGFNRMGQSRFCTRVKESMVTRGMGRLIRHREMFMEGLGRWAYMTGRCNGQETQRKNMEAGDAVSLLLCAVEAKLTDCQSVSLVKIRLLLVLVLVRAGCALLCYPTSLGVTLYGRNPPRSLVDPFVLTLCLDVLRVSF